MSAPFSTWAQGETDKELPAQMVATPTAGEPPAESKPLRKPRKHSGNNSLFMDKEGNRKPLSRVLVELADSAEVFSNAAGMSFARIEGNGHREVWGLKSQTFREWLESKLYKASGRGANASAMTDAIGTLCAKARHGGGFRREVYTRIYSDNERILIDLADDECRAVEVTRNGWNVISPDVDFIRGRTQQSIPVPIAGGKLDDLRAFINASDEDASLVIAWILSALRTGKPYPVLILQGEQGTGKSTITKLVRSLCDPSAVPMKSIPKEERDLLVSAANNHVIALDNLSGLQGWQSDMICRVATGGGFAARTLYTDADETAYYLQRPVILNGIDDLATRGDLASRALVIPLRPLGDNRISESELERKWEAARPRIFGALLDALACALKSADTVKLKHKPRMLDFALWSTAALGDKFEAAYIGNQESLIDESLNASPLATAVQALMMVRDQWQGSPADLLAELGNHDKQGARNGQAWPQAPRGLTNSLRRLAPHLRHIGIELEQGTGGRNGRDYVIRKVAKQAFQAFPRSKPSKDRALQESAMRSASVPDLLACVPSVPENPVTMWAGTDGTLGTLNSPPSQSGVEYDL